MTVWDHNSSIFLHQLRLQYFCIFRFFLYFLTNVLINKVKPGPNEFSTRRFTLLNTRWENHCWWRENEYLIWMQLNKRNSYSSIGIQISSSFLPSREETGLFFNVLQPAKVFIWFRNLLPWLFWAGLDINHRIIHVKVKLLKFEMFQPRQRFHKCIYSLLNSFFFVLTSHSIRPT